MQRLPQQGWCRSGNRPARPCRWLWASASSTLTLTLQRAGRGAGQPGLVAQLFMPLITFGGITLALACTGRGAGRPGPVAQLVHAVHHLWRRGHGHLQPDLLPGLPAARRAAQCLQGARPPCRPWCIAARGCVACLAWPLTWPPAGAWRRLAPARCPVTAVSAQCRHEVWYGCTALLGGMRCACVGMRAVLSQLAKSALAHSLHLLT